MKMLNTEKIIEGFAEEVSVLAGQHLNLKIRCLINQFTIQFSRIETPNSILFEVKNLKGNKQNIPRNPYLGVEWDTAYTFNVPLEWISGVYVATLIAQGSRFYIFFIIRGLGNEIAVLASTNTWQAYNFWGKGCFYNIYGAKQVPVISTQRPITTSAPKSIIKLIREAKLELFHNNHILSVERLLFQWMSERYPYDVISDQDLNLLHKYKILVIGCHAEYWSEEMYNYLENFMLDGGFVIYLGGNALYWKVSLSNNFIKCDKENHETWRRLGRSEASVLGVQYTDTGYTTIAPFQVKNSKHWVFENTNLKDGDLFGKYASGWEMDKTAIETPKDTVILAKGTNMNYSGADMVCRDNVFSVGSVSYTGNLNDPIVSKITENVFQRFGAKIIF